jgi:thiol-disulfide isomerase/thioredoxin
MKSFTLSAAALALLITSCSKTPEVQAPPAMIAPAKAEIAWVRPAAMTDVDRAFEQAKANKQPVFLYWAAAWCPPCNQVKSTIFTRPDFIEKSRSFVPVYVDGDTPSGQALGKRFSVGGYPTMVLLRPDGTEITRLAGSVEPAKYMQVLDYGIAGGSSAREALASALSGKPIGAEDWRLLAFYSWETDEQQMVPKQEVPATLIRLAQACPADQREAASRLTLQAIASSATAKGEVKPAAVKADALASVRSILARPELVREHYDLIAGYAADIVGYTTAPKSREREELLAAWNAALDRLIADPTLSNGGRIWALGGKVDLARLDNKSGPLPVALLKLVRAQVARADRETTDINERQSVITSAGAVLADAGLLDESDVLLSVELERSHSPYYYMLGLASNARKRGTPDSKIAAIEWARQAYETSKGPATRLQWGGAYVNYLLELSPTSADRIETAAAAVVGEAVTDPDAFAARSRSSLERLSKRLQKWNKDGKHDATLALLHERMTATCSAETLSPADRDACAALFAPARRA